MLNLNTPEEQMQAIKNKIADGHCTSHEITGTSKLAIGVTGPTQGLDEKDFLVFDCVEEVHRVSKPYKLVSREMKQEDTVIAIGDDKIGGSELTIIAGPCSIESREQLFDIAGELKEMGVKFLRAGAYKPRSSPYALQGLKEKVHEY
jgi:3-deoxy-7-phosphoheptulonate synthase